MIYQVEFRKDAERGLARLDRSVGQRILNKLKWLSENYDDTVPEPLEGPWGWAYKLRVGDYRAIYTLDRRSKIISVHFVGHRREIYKSK